MATTYRILETKLDHTNDRGYIGYVRFELDGHKQAYELTLHSDRGLNDWNYSLHFASVSGSEAQIEEAERLIEEDDAFFDALIEAATANIQPPEEPED